MFNVERYLKKNIEPPEQGIIHAEGFISPKGEVFDLAGDEDTGKPSFRHGDWIVYNKDWLESQGYKIKFPTGLNIYRPGVMSGETNDMLRDQLVRQGWIHVLCQILFRSGSSTVSRKKEFGFDKYDYLKDSEEIVVHEQRQIQLIR